MKSIAFEKKLLKLLKNRASIPSSEWQKAENGEMVVWILDRDDGTAGGYETSQERIGITLEGNILWGFSSGCSCWSGWNKEDYEKSVSYKEFILIKGNESRHYDTKSDQWGFVLGWQKEAEEKVDELLKKIEGKDK